jgi:hypothetical protein
MTGTPQRGVGQGQNLIIPSKINAPRTAPAFWKAFVLDLLSIISAGTFGWAYYRYLTDGPSVWILFTALTLFAVVSTIQVFLAENAARRTFVILMETVATLGWFWRDDSAILVITAFIVFIMLFWGYLSARIHVVNSIQIPFFGASGNVLGKFTTGILLFMILIYVPQIGGNALVLSRQSFGTFFDWTAGIVNSFYPDLLLTGSFGNFAQSFSKMELQNNPNFQKLNTAQQSVAVQEEADQFAASFARGSSTVATSSPTSDAFYNMLNGVLSAWQSQSSGWFDAGWVTVLFIGLRTLGIVFIWIAQFVSLMFYEFLLATGFMKISEQTRQQEAIGY